MPLYPNITLSILAGGKAKRFNGTNKALLKYGDEYFVSKIIRSLSSLFGETIIISNSVEDLKFTGLSIYEDMYKNQGPLGGIHSALKNAKKDAIFVVSCDMPFACSSVANKIAQVFCIKNVDAVVPKIGDNLEPMYSIYSKCRINDLEKLLDSSDSLPIRKFLENIDTYYLSIAPSSEARKCFININSPADLTNLLDSF